MNNKPNKFNNTIFKLFGLNHILISSYSKLFIQLFIEANSDDSNTKRL
jgi:hypothetical protein